MKNKRRLTLFCVFFSIVLSVLLLCSCSLDGSGNGEQAAKTKRTITFYVDGEPLTTVKTAGMEKIALPTAEKDGYDFMGWFFTENADPATDTKLTEEYFSRERLTYDPNAYAVFILRTSISLDRSALTAYSGDAGELLHATIVPAERWNEVTCASSDPSVATFTLREDGTLYVKALASGETTFSLVFDGKRTECAVTVRTLTVDVRLNGEKLGSFTTDSVARYSVVVPFSPTDYLPARSTSGKYFSGWFLDEELTVSLSGADTLKNGDAIYGAWKDFVLSDFNVSFRSNAIELTKCKITSPCVILPRVLNDYDVIGVTSTFFTSLRGTSYLSVPDTIRQMNVRKAVSLTYVDVWEGNENYSAENGVLYNADGTSLLLYPIARKDETFTVPASVTTIGYEAFDGAQALRTVVLPEGLSFIDGYAFRDCASLTTIDLPNSLKEISDYAFFGCAQLEELTLPAGLTRLRTGAFRECVKLATITLPAQITAVEDDLFYGCKALRNVTYAGEVTKIGKDAFCECTSLPSLFVPASVTTIEAGAFRGCDRLASVAVEEGSERFAVRDGALYTADGKRFLLYPTALTTVTTYSVRVGAEEVDPYAFAGTMLTEIMIPDGVTKIGARTFEKCRALTRLTLPMLGASLDEYDKRYPIAYYFGDEAFEGGVLTEQSMTNAHGSSSAIRRYVPGTLSHVTLTGGYVVYGAFTGCNSLRSVTIGSGVLSVGDYAFSNCFGLQEVVLEEGLTEIASYAFSGCFSLYEIVIPQSVTKIGACAFYDATNVVIYCKATEKPLNYRDSWNKTYFGGDFEEVPTYWYSETAPETEGLFWHYDADGATILVWE